MKKVIKLISGAFFTSLAAYILYTHGAPGWAVVMFWWLGMDDVAIWQKLNEK